jgi:hypothetical protein
VFFYLVGELLFFDEDGKTVLWQENWKTAIERYTNYCQEHGLEVQDLTSFTA